MLWRTKLVYLDYSSTQEHTIRTRLISRNIQERDIQEIRTQKGKKKQRNPSWGGFAAARGGDESGGGGGSRARAPVAESAWR
jgi:hypothetical protein